MTYLSNLQLSFFFGHKTNEVSSAQVLESRSLHGASHEPLEEMADQSKVNAYILLYTFADLIIG